MNKKGQDQAYGENAGYDYPNDSYQGQQDQNQYWGGDNAYGNYDYTEDSQAYGYDQNPAGQSNDDGFGFEDP